MFKFGNNANVAKEESNPIPLDLKPDNTFSSTGKSDQQTAISVHPPHDNQTILGEGVIIEGKISGSGNIIIEGLMKGDVDLEENSLTVGPKGRIEGDIIVRDAVISGQVNGKVNAVGTVNITQHADCCGEIKAKSISIEDGAFFNGKIELDRGPNRNIETAGGRMYKPGEKQSKVSIMPVAESNNETCSNPNRSKIKGVV
jgi:cytoskeletal protein CcmA (bactofilin family)